MKYSRLPQIIGAGILTLSMIVAPLTLPASAQVEIEREGIYEDNDFDWGWLGLIGLFGLAGLAVGTGTKPLLIEIQIALAIGNNTLDFRPVASKCL